MAALETYLYAPVKRLKVGTSGFLRGHAQPSVTYITPENDQWFSLGMGDALGSTDSPSLLSLLLNVVAL